jgi:hypothetical protein
MMWMMNSMGFPWINLRICLKADIVMIIRPDTMPSQDDGHNMIRAEIRRGVEKGTGIDTDTKVVIGTETGLIATVTNRYIKL